MNDWLVDFFFNDPDIKLNLPVPSEPIELTIPIPKGPSLGSFRLSPEQVLMQMGLLDNYRIVVKVVEIVDQYTFTGAWHGEMIKCVAYPSTANLAVGTGVVVTRITGTTVFFYWEAILGGLLPAFSMIIWSGSYETIPEGWMRTTDYWWYEEWNDGDSYEGGECSFWGGVFPYGALDEEIDANDPSWYPVGGYSTHPIGNHRHSIVGITIEPSTHKHTDVHTWYEAIPIPDKTSEVGASGICAGSDNPPVPVAAIPHRHTATLLSNETSEDSHGDSHIIIDVWYSPAKTGYPISGQTAHPPYRSLYYILCAEEQDIPIGGIVNWSGANIPAGFALCDGNNGTPDLRDLFVIAAGSIPTGATGGSATVSSTHTHSAGGAKLGNGEHAHTLPGMTFSEESRGYQTVGSSTAQAAGPTQHGDVALHSHPPLGGALSSVTSTYDKGSHDNVHSFQGTLGSYLGEDIDQIPPWYTLAFIMRVS
jgi:hypothetical protein